MHNPQLDYFIRQAESSAQSNLTRLHRVETLRELMMYREATVPSVIASLRHTLPTVRRLRTEAERRAEELVHGQLTKLEKLLDDEAFEIELLTLRTKEWVHLRGNYPRLASLVAQQADILRSKRAKE